MKGTCRECKRKRIVAQTKRFGGGNYRRPGRYYWSSICLECATELLAGTHENESFGRRVLGWPVENLRRVVEQLTKWAERDAAADEAK